MAARSLRSPLQDAQDFAVQVVETQQRGAPANPRCSRWRSRSCTAGLHGPVARRTVPSTRTAPPAFPPGNCSSTRAASHGDLASGAQFQCRDHVWPGASAELGIGTGISATGELRPRDRRPLLLGNTAQWPAPGCVTTIASRPCAARRSAIQRRVIGAVPDGVVLACPHADDGAVDPFDRDGRSLDPLDEGPQAQGVEPAERRWTVGGFPVRVVGDERAARGRRGSTSTAVAHAARRSRVPSWPRRQRSAPMPPPR